jgi:hypothetical protein
MTSGKATKQRQEGGCGPGDPEIACGIGLVQKVEGQNAQARAALESALASDASQLMTARCWPT